MTPSGVQGTRAGLPDGEPPDIQRVEPVHVLGRIDRLEHGLGADLRRQRKLHQDAVDRRVGVEPADLCQQRRLGGVRGQADGADGDAGLVGGAVLGAHIDSAGGIVADQHHGQAGAETPARRSAPPAAARSAAAIALPSMIRALMARSPRGSWRGAPHGQSAASRGPSTAGSPVTNSSFSRAAAPAATRTAEAADVQRVRQGGAGGPVGAAVLGRFADGDAQPRSVGRGRGAVQPGPARSRLHLHRHGHAVRRRAPERRHSRTELHSPVTSAP